jgi:hypothetical protein
VAIAPAATVAGAEYPDAGSDVTGGIGEEAGASVPSEALSGATPRSDPATGEDAAAAARAAGVAGGAPAGGDPATSPEEAAGDCSVEPGWPGGGGTEAPGRAAASG